MSKVRLIMMGGRGVRVGRGARRIETTATRDEENVFDPFYRGSNVTDDVPGSGIGLAGVRQIVEMHGGTVSVERTAGEGSTFTVRLPRGTDC